MKLVQPATYSSSYSAVSNSAKVQYQYNSLNQLSSLSTNGTTYTFTYDNFGNKNSVSIGGTTIVSQTYNSYNGKINTVTYANGTTVSYEYDKLDRVKTLTLTQNGVATKYEYEYDANGNLNKYIDHSSDIVTLYKYDLSGRMIGSIEYDSETMKNLSSAKYNYNDESQLSSIYYRKDYIYNSTSYGSLSNYRNFQYNDFDNISRYDFSSVYSSEKYTVIPNYDGHNRIDSKKVSLTMGSSSAENNLTYEYATNGTNGSVLITKYTSQVNSGAVKTYQYTYDSANNNITKITNASGVIQYQYAYDNLGRLIREDNLDANRTYVYTYDSDGNILTKKTYGYTTASGTPSTTLYSTYSYTYGNSSWKDQLTSYRGYSITYDSMGNPLSYYNGNRMYFTWIHGTNLATVGSSSSTPHTYYTYNDGGIRTSKIVNGVEHRYMLDGSMILSEEYGDKLFVYVYDENGAPIGVKYRESDYTENVFDCYLYEKNLQGDIIGIYNADGTQVVWYSYDAWGNNYYGAYLGDSEGKYEAMCYANPFRYRGYYWDSETGFYYCGSRYYDPAIGRFINADTTNTLLSTAMSLTDKNLYAYCDNNPVMRVDDGGMFWDTFFDAVSLCFSVVDVIKNPDDPMAWVGLAADVVSLAVPFATGGGLIVDAVTKADDVVDLAKNIDRLDDTVDVVNDIGKTTSNIIDDANDLYDATKSIDNFDNTPFVPDEYWQRKASPYGTPNSKIEHKRLLDNGQIETSTVIYDKAGRQSVRIDWTNHGRLDHGNPHVHFRIYSKGNLRGFKITLN